MVTLGSVALHLKGLENKPKIDGTIDLLIGALKTPIVAVELSVADALTKLMKKGRTQERIERLLDGILRDCIHGQSLAMYHGGAFGLFSGRVVHGPMRFCPYGAPECPPNLEDCCQCDSLHSDGHPAHPCCRDCRPSCQLTQREDDSCRTVFGRRCWQAW